MFQQVFARRLTIALSVLVVLLSLCVISAQVQYPTPPLNVGTGVYGSPWPYNIAKVDHPQLGKIARGTIAAPDPSLLPIFSIISNGAGDLGPNGTDVYMTSERSNGEAVTLGLFAHARTAGHGAGVLMGHVLADAGTPSAKASNFPTWITCQLWSQWDNCGSEWNTVNVTNVNPDGQGEYLAGKSFLYGLAMINADSGNPNSEASSAYIIATQNTKTAKWQRGIDFQNGSIKNYSIVLPNSVPVVARNGNDTEKVPVFTPLPNGDLQVNGKNRIYLAVNGTNVAYIDASGQLVSLTGSGSTGTRPPDPPAEGSQPPQPPSLLANGGFESELAGWTPTGAATVVSMARTGFASARIVAQWASVSQRVPVSAGAPYTFSAWLRPQGADDKAYVVMAFTDAAGTQVGPTAWGNFLAPAAPEQWNLSSVSATAPAGAVKVLVVVISESKKGGWLVDDCTFSGPQGSQTHQAPTLSSSALDTDPEQVVTNTVIKASHEIPQLK